MLVGEKYLNLIIYIHLSLKFMLMVWELKVKVCSLVKVMIMGRLFKLAERWELVQGGFVSHCHICMKIFTPNAQDTQCQLSPVPVLSLLSVSVMTAWLWFLSSPLLPSHHATHSPWVLRFPGSCQILTIFGYSYIEVERENMFPINKYNNFGQRNPTCEFLIILPTWEIVRLDSHPSWSWLTVNFLIYQFPIITGVSRSKFSVQTPNICWVKVDKFEPSSF